MPAPLAIHWVLRQRLAIGAAPTSPEHLQLLADAGVAAVLSLCSEAEAPPPPGFSERFVCRRVVLADHRSTTSSTPAELLSAVHTLEQLLATASPVYVHCLASVERSPLVCIAWLMRERRLTRLQALDYLMAIHPLSSPLPGQLALLDAL